MPHFPPPRRSRSGSHRAVPPSLRPSPFGRVGVKDEEISQAAPSSPAPAASPPPAAPPAAPIAQQPPSPAPSPSPVAAPSSPPAAAPTPPAPNQAAPTPAPAQQTQQPAQPAQPRITAPWVPRWNSEPTLSPNIQDFDDVHGEVTSWLLDNQQPLSQLLQNSENDSNRFAQRVATLFGNNLIQQGMHIDNVRHIQDAIFDLSLTEAEYLKEEEKQRTATPTTQEGWSEELFGQPLRGGELLHRATPLLGVAALPGAQVVLRHVDKFGLNFSIKHPDLVSADRKLYVSRATGRKIIYNEILRSRYPGQGLGSRLLAAQVEQARQHGFIIQTLGLDYVNGAGEHSMQGASFWPRVGYNAPLRDISGTKLYDKIRKHYPEAQTLQDLMYSPGGTEAWKQWVAEDLVGEGDKIGVDLIFDPNDEKAVALLTNYNLRKQQKLASQGKSFQVKEADLAAHYEDPGASPEDDDLLVQAAQQAQQQFGAFGSKSFRPTEYTPALYRSYDTASLPRGELDNEELHNSNSHGNLFGTAQVTSHKKPPQESLESYDFDSPEHRVKELETPHKFSSTQFDLDQAGYPRSQGSPVAKLKEIQDSIQDSDLAEDGKEDNFHVTVLYGLHGDNPKEVEHVLRHWLMDREHTSLQAQLGEVSLFPANEQNSQRGGAYYDVVKVDVDSDDLHSLHNFLAQHLQHTDTHPEYHPHVTLAYVKPGLGWLYVGEDLNGHIIHLNKFVFSDKHGQKTIIDLSKLKTCPQCGHKIKALDNEPGWRCSQPPCEWSLFAAGDTDMDMEAHPQPPISNQEPWERAHRDRKEEEVQPYTSVKSVGGLGLGNGFTFYRQAFDRWRTKPNVLGERRLILAYRRHKPADELAMQNDEEFRMKKESTQPTQSEHKRPKNTCPDGSKRPPGTGSCQGREGGWDGRGDNEQSLSPEENWYPGDMPAGVPPKEKAFRCPDGSPRPHSQATCAGREGWVPWTEEERLQNTLSEPPKGPRAEQENIHAKYPNAPRVTPSPFGRKSLDKKSASQRAVAADLVTLPKDIEGTNCKNCQFLAKDQKDYCQHPDLMLHLWDGAERMTCSLWDTEGVKHPDAKQGKKSLPVLDANELARAQKADLITLPKDVENTSCRNCEYQQDKYCHNPKVDQPVTPRNCCNYWDADGVKRAWEQQGNKAFDRPLHMPPRYRLHPEQDTYRSIEGTDLYSRQDFGKGLRYQTKDEETEKAMSWLGSGSGGDLVAPPAWGSPKDEEKLHKAFSSLKQVKALPPLSHGHQPTLAVDLDGTLADTPPHAGAMDLDLVHPRPGAVEAMEHFHKLGWRIIIWTCRDDIKGIEGWLKQHNIPWDFINENPDQPTDSPKIIADYYLDDRSIRPDNWQQAQAEIEQAAEARQPVGADANYETLKELGEESLPLLAKLMATLGYPTLQLDRIAPNELEGRLQQPGPLVLLAPLKAQQRAEQKVESDYGGDWTRLLDMVRAAVAVDTFDELKAAIAKLEESASPARKPKNRFKKPLANGYRDYLINYKLPNGFICEVQFHLKPILAAREKEKLAYDIVRAIRAALQEEGRSSMTSGEVAAMQRARATSQRLFEEAWQHALQQQPDKKEKKKKMLTAPRVKASPFGRVFGKAGYTGIFRDRLGRRTCYAAGRKVPCNPHGNNATDDSNKPSPRPPELDQPVGPPTGAAGGKPKQPTLEGAGGPGVPNYYGVIFNQQGQLLIQPGNDPLGGFIWAVPSPANERPVAGLLQEVQQATDAVPRQIGEIGEPDQRNGYYLLKVEDAGDQSQQWSSPKEVEEQLQQLQDPAWQKRGLDVLHAAVQQWQQSQRRRKSLIAPSLFGKKAQPTFTGPIQDSRGRRMCFRDGKHAPCEQFGGKGEGWQQQRATEDLYDAARRLVSKSKTGDANGQNELLSMLAATPPEELASLKRDHNLHAAPASKEELKKQIIDKLSKLGYEVEEGQTQRANPLG